MAIFSRRTIQNCINENNHFLKRRQTENHVKRLNRSEWESFGAEWEVVLLNAFSKLGKVIHEPKFGRTPDIYFECEDSSSKSFIADIVTVTDAGLKQRFPVDALYEELMKRVHEHGIKGDFQIKVEGNMREFERGGPKPKLKLPHASRFSRDIFNQEFYAFLDNISRSKDKTHRFHLKDSDIDVAFIYSPGDGRVLINAHSYTHITSLTENILFERLEDKYDALNNAKYLGPRAIILCDGVCSLFKPIRDGVGYTIDDIISHFLKQRPSISFVLTLSAEYVHSEGKVFLAHNYYAGQSESELDQDVIEALKKLPSILPEPHSDILNARNYLKLGRQHGSVKVGSTEIEFSARSILNLLSGKVKPEHLFYHSPNPFAEMLKEGRLIKEIRIKRTREDDDDEWMIFKFGDPDPAVSPFIVPMSSTSKSFKADSAT